MHDNRLENIKSFLRSQHRTVEKEILDEAEGSLSQYSLVGKRLGLNGVSLATLLTYVNFGQGFSKIMRQVGRTSHHKKTRKFSRKAKRALNGLATHSVRQNSERYGQLYKYYLGILKSRKRALLRIQTWILKDIHHIVTGRPLREAPNPSG